MKALESAFSQQPVAHGCVDRIRSSFDENPCSVHERSGGDREVIYKERCSTLNRSHELEDFC